MKARYQEAQDFQDFLEKVEANRTLWHQVYERAVVPGVILAKATALGGRWHLLVISEDWCGDAVNTVPYLARLAESAPNIDMRLLTRDENPDLMDAHLNGTSRSIPVVMILDEHFQELAWWGSRPRPLQDLFLSELKELDPGERSVRLRAWYARDKGRTALAEVLELMPVLP